MASSTIELTTTTSAATLYEDLAEVSSALYKKALTDLPPDVRGAVSAAQNRED